MAEIFTPDNLIAGDFPIITENVTVLSGQNLVRGAVIAKKTVGAATVTGAGTGKGALTMDATTPLLAGVQVGTYKAVCITAATDGGTFRVSDPKGNVLGDIAVGETFANQIKFAIADGATDFAAGDTISIAIAAGSGKCVIVDKAAIDGAQKPVGIISHDCDASSADKTAVAYLTGEFYSGSLSFAADNAVADHKDALRDLSIFVK